MFIPDFLSHMTIIIKLGSSFALLCQVRGGPLNAEASLTASVVFEIRSHSKWTADGLLKASSRFLGERWMVSCFAVMLHVAFCARGKPHLGGSRGRVWLEQCSLHQWSCTQSRLRLRMPSKPKAWPRLVWFGWHGLV